MGIGITNNAAEATSGVHVTNNQMHVRLETNTSTGYANIGGVRIFSENDNGSVTGEIDLASPETDQDYRLKTANDTLLDTETYNYAAQNTGKHQYSNTTLTMTWGTNGFVTNGGAVNTTNIGATMGTYAEFPVLAAHSIYCEIEGGFNAQPVANCSIDFGMFRRGVTTQFAPTDGVYFRINASGVFGIVNNSGSETPTTAFDFTYELNHKYQFIITINQRICQFWIDGVKYGEIETPDAQGQCFMSTTLPFSIRHAHSGTAGGVLQFTLNNYSILIGGTAYAEQMCARGNAMFGSYQGLSGGTMGHLLGNTSTSGTLVNPSAVVLSNTTATSGVALGTGGQTWEAMNAGLAMNTDGIIMEYLNPAGTVSIQGKRMAVKAVKLSSFVQSTLAGGPMNNVFTLAYGHTAPSLATVESATAKTPRRVMLPELTQQISTTIVIGTLVPQTFGVAYFDNPIYINPGEYVALTVKHVGSSFSTGVISYNMQLDYGLE